MTVKSVTYSPADDDLIVEVEGGATVPLSQISRIDAPWVPPQPASVAAGGVNALPSGAAGSGTGSTPSSALQDALKGLFAPGP